jgi:hypothetical protein
MENDPDYRSQDQPFWFNGPYYEQGRLPVVVDFDCKTKIY